MYANLSKCVCSGMCVSECVSEGKHFGVGVYICKGNKLQEEVIRVIKGLRNKNCKQKNVHAAVDVVVVLVIHKVLNENFKKIYTRKPYQTPSSSFSFPSPFQPF